MAIKNALVSSAFSILTYQIQILIFRRIRIDPFDDLGDFFRSQLTGMSAGLLFCDQQTVRTIPRQDYRAGSSAFQRTGVGGEVQAAQGSSSVAGGTFCLEQRADGVIPRQVRGSGWGGECGIGC